MIHNYPIKQENQHEHSQLPDLDFIDTSDEVIADTSSTDLLADVEIEMSRSVYDMRREFHRTAKRFKSHFAEKEPRESIYKFGYTYPEGLHFMKRRAMG